MIDAEYDDKGYCWVNNAELNDLMNKNGFKPDETNSKYWKYRTKLRDEQHYADFDQVLKQELTESYNKLCEIITQWQDEQRNEKYSLDRWQL
ncbi:hypothetical protein ACN6KS_21260 [Paenibacillus nitricinens]|uniref:hypothetical protein n=1 Tax=Paenibacillus nitricinens TaxID=3367691 RepID=UPI003F87129B